MSEPDLNNNPADEEKDWRWRDFGPDELVDDSYAAEVGVVVADGSQTNGVE